MRAHVGRPPAFCYECCGKQADWNDMSKLVLWGKQSVDKQFPPPEKVPQMCVSSFQEFLRLRSVDHLLGRPEAQLGGCVSFPSKPF